MRDISGLSNVLEIYNTTLIKNWVKLVPVEKTILFNDYKRKDHFIPIAEIVLDDEAHKTGKKKRETLIKFVPKIDTEAFTRKTEWLYILNINDRIVKIGGTRTGIKGRISSYLCGHHIEERSKSGDCSKTNGFIYNTLQFYLHLGCRITMYGHELPKTEVTVNIFGKDVKILTQTYHIYESVLLEEYKKQYNEYPILHLWDNHYTVI